MSFFIKEYTGGHRILSVAKSHDAVNILNEQKKNYIFFDNRKIQIVTGGKATNVSCNIDTLDDFDVIEVVENGIADIVYQKKSDDNAIVVTTKCNSNCVMCPCSEMSRKKGFISSLERLQEILKYIPKDARHITITGGEPTLLKNDIFIFMEQLQRDYFNTEFLLLTNGRAFASKTFTDKFISVKPDKMRVAIPIYGYNEETHDSITQAKGSFVQAVEGIKNLLAHHMDIEIRIVISKLNIHYMQEVAEFIINNFKGIEVVHFMAIEMMGNAAKNSELVWIPYENIFEYIKQPIISIIESGIDVELYNFPLCTVDKEFWSMCRKSISGYKVCYPQQCHNCLVQSLCGGMFNSTMKFCRFNPQPILER